MLTISLYRQTYGLSLIFVFPLDKCILFIYLIKLFFTLLHLNGCSFPGGNSKNMNNYTFKNKIINNFNLNKRVTACVVCEIALRDYQENVSTGQTHGQTDATDRQTPDKVIHLCRYASQATQKPQHLKKKMTAQVIFWMLRRSSAGIYSVPTHCIYTWYFFLDWPVTPQYLTRPTPGTCDVNEK